MAVSATSNPSTIRSESRLVEYGLDSVRAMDLVVSIEEEFSLAVPDELAAQAKTTRDVVRFIETRLASREGVLAGSPTEGPDQ